jgi:Ca2+-binding RTX toxin-like protein
VGGTSYSEGAVDDIEINAGTGASTVTVGAWYSNVWGATIAVNGQGGNDTLTIDTDSRETAPQTFLVGETFFGSITSVDRFTVTYANVQAVELFTRLGATVQIYTPLSTSLAIHGVPSPFMPAAVISNVLQLTAYVDAVWHITGTNSGTLNGVVTFSNFPDLIGSVGRDRFVFAPSGNLSGEGYDYDTDLPFFRRGTINGGGGRDTLDYSAFTSAVAVDLVTGTAPGCSVSAVENVFGGSNNDILTGSDLANVLVGGAGNDRINGGAGRDFLIGGLGTDTLDGGADDDIVLAGTTSYDLNDMALDIIMREWTRTNLNSSYSQRVARLEAGFYDFATQTSVRLARNVTVFADTRMESLRGGDGLDWFWADPDRTFQGPLGYVVIPGDRAVNRLGTERVS